MSTKRFIYFKSTHKCWPKSELLKNKMFKSVKDFCWVRIDMWQVFHLPLAFQGTPCRRRFVWQTTRDRSCSDPELFPHQDNTDPSLLGIFWGNQVGHHMASTPWWVLGELRWRKTREKANKPHVKAPYSISKIQLLMAFSIKQFSSHKGLILLGSDFIRIYFQKFAIG